MRVVLIRRMTAAVFQVSHISRFGIPILVVVFVLKSFRKIQRFVLAQSSSLNTSSKLATSLQILPQCIPYGTTSSVWSSIWIGAIKGRCRSRREGGLWPHTPVVYWGYVMHENVRNLFFNIDRKHWLEHYIVERAIFLNCQNTTRRRFSDLNLAYSKCQRCYLFMWSIPWTCIWYRQSVWGTFSLFLRREVFTAVV